MQPRATTVTKCLSQEVIDISCPNNIVLYQQYMEGVDKGIQYSVIGAGFSKKQRDGELNRYKALKWEFYIAVTEQTRLDA
eukprot:2709570-Ditylum_brightwellii.AAC.1